MDPSVYTMMIGFVDTVKKAVEINHFDYTSARFTDKEDGCTHARITLINKAEDTNDQNCLAIFLAKYMLATDLARCAILDFNNHLMWDAYDKLNIDLIDVTEELTEESDRSIFEFKLID